MLQTFNYDQPFHFEEGGSIASLKIAYHTYGALNANKDNVVWICHALTANSDAADWWKGLVGPGRILDPQRYFIVCANILGSCYGTTGPASLRPDRDVPYGKDFPVFTIRDMVKAHELLSRHLEIAQIQLLVGGSMGGYQALEWTLKSPERIQKLFLLATSAAESAWGIAIHTAQRMAIEADPEWQSGIRGTGDKGLKAARAIGMLTYRNFQLFNAQQSDPDPEKTKDFKASAYLQYQAQKLADRFDPLTYHGLTRAMDSHNIARGRHTGIAAVLGTVKQPTLVIGISSDILCPPAEQRFMAEHLPACTYREISSEYGHDGFLIEYELISEHLNSWLNGS
ncbi:MAG: homoserine O-acetyltransferase [Sphingobacteriales bacterium]|nr:MAG: homoserine O-acetyltransferase [Sphingobacteriales bacterium]